MKPISGHQNFLSCIARNIAFVFSTRLRIIKFEITTFYTNKLKEVTSLCQPLLLLLLMDNIYYNDIIRLGPLNMSISIYMPIII